MSNNVIPNAIYNKPYYITIYYLIVPRQVDNEIVRKAETALIAASLLGRNDSTVKKGLRIYRPSGINEFCRGKQLPLSAEIREALDESLKQPEGFKSYEAVQIGLKETDDSAQGTETVILFLSNRHNSFVHSLKFLLGFIPLTVLFIPLAVLLSGIFLPFAVLFIPLSRLFLSITFQFIQELIESILGLLALGKIFPRQF